MRIRSFQPSDTAALIEISKHTWGGYDQLPYELDELQVNPNSYLYVMEYWNRIVAFANLNVIDGGKTGWLEHMRVHWRFRKRGFAWTMTRRLISEAEALGVKRVRLATTMENEATRRISNRIRMRQILQMKLFWKGNYRGIRWNNRSVPVISCTSDEAYKFLTAHPALTSEGVIVYDWHAFDLTEEIFSLIGDQFQFWKTKGNGKAGALAFGYRRIVRDAPLWVSTIYALNTPAFYSILSYQLQTAKNEQAQSVLCFHSLPYQAAHEIPGLKRSTFSSTLVVFEKHRPFLNSRV